ncbi:glycine oxidase ThiO [Patulibacter sp.]|uniref:glycine oxidase ThiO n=1 Tax=Patulibacter sp. TaxID=1912859 RepID=UPI0027239C2C|nr:glycine oxidase ThiO [Patulibacter sp.]MDO9407599.1 glycine oxidase ThiO [Patulibacter sp.]
MPAPSALPADRSTDVLVVGAGLAGLPVALELARRGASVRVVDPAAPGSGTSRVAAGMLAPVTEAEPDDPAHLLVGRAGLDRWPAFAATLAAASGVDVPLHAAGTLALARDRDEAEALTRFSEVCGRFGLPVERLLPSAARRLEPALAPTLRGALSVPGDLAVDPRRVVAALVAGLPEHGVEVTAVAVERVLLEDVAGGGSRATGALLADAGVLRAGAVVLATGARPVGGLPDGARVPVRPVKGQLLVLRDPSGPGLVERVLRFGHGYLVPRDDGRYVLGATTEERGFDVATTAWALHELLRDGFELVPGLLDLEVEETLAGLRPTTPDALPVIGPAAGVDGLWWATGHHRNGVLLAPLTGVLLADALTGTPRTPADERVASLVDPRRFAVADPGGRPADGPHPPASPPSGEVLAAAPVAGVPAIAPAPPHPPVPEDARA